MHRHPSLALRWPIVITRFTICGHWIAMDEQVWTWQHFQYFEFWWKETHQLNRWEDFCIGAGVWIYYSCNISNGSVCR